MLLNLNYKSIYTIKFKNSITKESNNQNKRKEDFFSLRENSPCLSKNSLA